MYQTFVDAGYDDLEEILEIMNSPWEITQDDLRVIGINKPGYRHRILSKLKEDSLGIEMKQYVCRRDIDLEKNINTSACELCIII